MLRLALRIVSILVEQQSFGHFRIENDGVQTRINLLIPKPQFPKDPLRAFHPYDGVPHTSQKEVNAVAVRHDPTKCQYTQTNEDEPRNGFAQNLPKTHFGDDFVTWGGCRCPRTRMVGRVWRMGIRGRCHSGVVGSVIRWMRRRKRRRRLRVIGRGRSWCYGGGGIVRRDRCFIVMRRFRRWREGGGFVGWMRRQSRCIARVRPIVR